MLCTQEITNRSLAEYLTARYRERSRDDFSHFLSELVGELRGGGFRTIGEVDIALERTKEVARQLEIENPPSQNEGSQYSAVGFVVVSITLLRGNDFFTFKTALDKCSPERLQEYRKHILPKIDESPPVGD
jgi:hypothetical protein